MIEIKPIQPYIATYMPDFALVYDSPVRELQRALKHVVSDEYDKEEIQHRNKRAYELLMDLKLLYPNIEIALESERDDILKWIDIACETLSKNFKSPQTVTLDNWWYLLLGKPKFIHTYTGSLIVVRRDWDHLEYDPGTGEREYNNETWISVEDVEYAKVEKERLESYKNHFKI